MTSQHDRDSRELRELCAQRDAARATVRQQAERIAELEGELTKRHKRLHDTEELAGHYLVQRDDATAERDQLRAEVEALRDSVDAKADRIDRLGEMVEELSADALRFRSIDWHWEPERDMGPGGRWWASIWVKEAPRKNTAVAAIDHARTTHKDEG